MSAVTVVFGAGASYDSDPARPSAGDNERPPLAQSLFEQFGDFNAAVARYRKVAPLATRLRQASKGGAPLEEELGRIVSEEGYPERPKQLLAIRYYLRRIVLERCQRWTSSCSGVTNYVTLAERLGKWAHDGGAEINYVTFNYDELVDGALSAAISFSPTDIGQYIRPGRTSLVKLHGSTDWWQRVRLPTDLQGSGTSNEEGGPQLVPTGELIAHAAALRPEGPEAIDITRSHPRYESYETAIPALAIPANVKRAFVCPPSHLEALRDILRRTTTLLIVGWQGNDPLFVSELNAWLRPTAELVIVNGSEVWSGQTALRLSGVAAQKTPLSMGFTDFMHGDELEKVLRRDSRARR